MTPSLDLAFTDKVAIVTGGASGIGLACAQTLARGGAAVVIADRQPQAGEAAVAAIIAAGGSASFLTVDVANPESAEQMVERCVQRHGRLDIAVNNAGISGVRGATGGYQLADWRQVIDVNLNGVFYCLRAELPAMIKQGGGAIVNLASILGSVALAGAPAYVAAKHAVVGLTRAAALDHAVNKIRVNSVGPGFIDTPMIAHALADPVRYANLIDLHPIGRLGYAQDIANMIAFLCSDQAAFITGAYYPVDGGYTAR